MGKRFELKGGKGMIENHPGKEGCKDRAPMIIVAIGDKIATKHI